MKPTRPAKRSVSPFVSQDLSLTGTVPVLDAWTALHGAINSQFGPAEGKPPKTLKTIEDLRYLPSLINQIAESPANDAPELSDLCHFLTTFQEQLDHFHLTDPVWAAFRQLFELKTEVFLIDHHDKEHCEKMGWPDDHRDMVLFAKERDLLVGRFFAPLTESQPGKFSEFINQWADSSNPDRILHFLDFSAGSKNPTFEHYLLFTHPALSRLTRDKVHLKCLFEKAEPILKKLSSPTWEKEIRAALGV